MNDLLPRTAIDTALVKGNLGCQFLEIVHPTTQDLKTAAEAFKASSDILKASLVLLEHDCRVVMDPPEPAAAPSTPLFDGKGQPNPDADVTTAAEPETRIAGAIGIIDVEIVETGRKFKVGDRVKDPDGDLGTVIEDDGSDEENEPYTVTTDGSGIEINWNASDLTVVTPDEEITLEPFPTGTKAAQKKVFDERLTTLEEIFCERCDLAGSTEPYGKQLKLFRPYRDAWVEAWKTDARATWPKLLAAIASANTLASEFDAWAPAA
jgi:hypothetical protein